MMGAGSIIERMEGDQVRIRVLAASVAIAALAATVPAGATPVRIRFVCFDREATQTQPNRRGVIRGTSGPDVIISLKREVLVFAGGGNDRICTGRGNDYVASGDGNDLVDAGGGSDRVASGTGSDYLSGRAGNDRLDGGVTGSDTLVGGGGVDLLSGGEDSADYLFGGAGGDALDGGAGDQPDLLIGGEGADRIDGGTGCCDTASFWFEPAAVQVDLQMPGVATNTGDVLLEIENVQGSTFDDTIVGSGGNNRLEGDDGADSISALGGLDVVDGGDGDDGLDGGEGADRLSFVWSPAPVEADLTSGASTGSGLDVLSGFENMLGSAYSDQLTGDAAPNTVDGSRGDDTLLSGEGDDTLYSGGGDAGPGEDMCFESSAANCELVAPVAPRPRSTITFPEQARTYDVAQLGTLEGTAAFATSGPERQLVALRLISSSGCYWLDARRGLLQAWHCGRPLWMRADVDGSGSWSLRVRDRTRTLIPGRYQLRTQTHDGQFVESTFETPYNLIEFRLR